MSRRLPGWTIAVTAIAIFMVSLDNLVVTNALTSIREDLGASIEALEWTVNAYTLAFAVFLLTGAALGDRFGRRRVFLVGLGIFTAASAAAALAPTTGALIAARAVQGLGAGIVAPLSLTLLSTAVAPERRGLALGIWSGVSGLGVALGPLVGGAVIEGISWQWIFWLNVPVGLVLVPLAARKLSESHGPAAAARPARPRARLDRPARRRVRRRARQPRRLGLGRGRRPDRRRRRAARRVRRLGAARAARRCCRCASSARARSPPPTASRSR